MKFQKRITNKKRHTVGFVIDGKHYTRNQAAKLVKKNKDSGYYAYRSGNVLCIAAKPNSKRKRLYSLPVVIK